MSESKERKRIGYVHEFHQNADMKTWVADQDLYNKTDEDVIKDVQHLLYGLVNPWSDTSVYYTINYNFEQNREKDDIWVARYVSPFYDCLESVIFAYGKTPEEALENVKKLYTKIIKFYIEEE